MRRLVEKTPGRWHWQQSPDCPLPTVRNFLYHLWPAGPTWKHRIEEMLGRLWLFNGRRVVAIATGPGAASVQEARDAWHGQVDDWIEVPNNPDLREALTLPLLLERVQSASPREATFFAHNMGALRKGQPIVERWTQLMLQSCLDYWPLVEATLARSPVAGSFKKLGVAFEGKSEASWHYSGTFFWMRNADVLARDWRRIDPHWWGAESWVGLHFASGEAGCLFHEGPNHEMDLYQPETFHRVIEPAWKLWQMTHSPERMAPHAL